MAITPRRQLKANERYIQTEKGRAARQRAQIAYRNRQRSNVIETLGGLCVLCGFDDVRALQVDHINGGGRKERQQIRSVTGYYKKIVQSFEDNRSEYQLLCANCNMIKRIENKEHKS